VPATKLHRIDATFNSVHGAIGCTYSHIQALTYAIDNNLPNVLIFEDDINFIEDQERISKSLQYIRNFKDFDVIQLTSFDFKVANFNPMLKKVNYCTMASGYIVNRPFMERLRANMQEGVAILEKSQAPGFRRQRHLSTLDHYWSRLQPGSRWYALRDRIVYQRKSYSDICKIIVDYKC
jgi:GR25 family glycosyltransferase involved in LPS biosynthesis